MIETVFVCTKHNEDVVTITQALTATCTECKESMEKAGWFESKEA